MRTKFLVFAILTLLAVTTVIFALNQAEPVKAQGAITIEVLSSVGGTTTPTPGTYTYTPSNGTAVLTAIPDSGWRFDHWVYDGYTPGHSQSSLPVDESNMIYDNPFDATHGYDTGGYTYSYQAVFVPSSVAASNSVAGVPTAEVVIMVAGLAAAVAVVGVAAYFVGKRKAK